MNNTAPPLKIWFYVLSSFLLIVISFTGYSYWVYPFNAKAKADKAAKLEKRLKEMIIENNTKDTSFTSVVIFGSSLSQCAFSNPGELKNQLSEVKKQKIAFLNITIWSLNMESAEEVNFFNHIKKYPPQYLFIENNRLNLDDLENGFKLPIPMDLQLTNTYLWLKRLCGLEVPSYDTYHFNERPFLLPKFYTDTFNTLAFNALRLKKHAVRHCADNKLANDAYSELMKKDTKIVFLNMPRCPALEEIHKQEHELELKQELEIYKNTYGIDYWTCPEVFKDSCFLDGGHLNYKGSKIYQNWFVNEFATIK